MPKKIIFMGTPLFAVPILKSLYQNGYPISVVYTQPPQKSNRGQRINKSPIQNMSETLNIDFRSPENLDTEQEYEFIKNLNPQKNNEGSTFGLNTIGESFFPNPDKIWRMSDGEFQGIDWEGVSIPAFAKLAADATSELLSRIRTSSPLDMRV